MADIIQIRRGTAAQWTAANTVLAEGEIGLETDTAKIKVGVAAGTAWNSLPYFQTGEVTLGANQTFTGANSFTGQTTLKEVKDTPYVITPGASIVINPANGSLQEVTLNTLSTTVDLSNFQAGHVVHLAVDDGADKTINWNSQVTWVKPGGSASAPTLSTTGFTWILLWKRGTVIYGGEVGKP